MVLWRCI